MPTVTYIGDVPRVTWCGVEFEAGIPVEDLDIRNPNHRHILDKAPTNRFYEVEGGIEDIEVVEEVKPAPDTTERDALRAELDVLGVSYHHKNSVATLKQMLEDATAPDVEPDPDYPEAETTDG